MSPTLAIFDDLLPRNRKLVRDGFSCIGQPFATRFVIRLFGVRQAFLELLHLAFDFPLHTHDARMHFWPLSDWVFESPVSYWDSRAHAGAVAPVALTMSVGAGVYLWVRHKTWTIKAIVAVLLAMELMSSGIWRFVF